MSILSKLVTFKRLGLFNLINVAIYRVALRLGYFVKKQPITVSTQLAVDENHLKIFFEKPISLNKDEKLELDQLKAFGWLPIETSSPPNWLQSITSKSIIDKNTQHWSRISDFSLNIGDIKTVWELSRFDWAPYFAVQYNKSHDTEILAKLNDWLNDWYQNNPANQGVNWKCGQEASIRVMHLAATAYLLNANAPISSPLTQLIYQHLLRIVPTMPYAMAQDNNHGTSEAAAVYIGSLLLKQQPEFANNQHIATWLSKGQYWLENRTDKLISEDGAFSQNSVNYHRLMLDSISLVEFFRQQYNEEKFHSRFYQKMKKASQWLFLMTEEKTGRAPILGLNDGARLLPITSCDYLDYRPSVQWAFALFFGYWPYSKSDSYQQLSTLFPPNAVQESAIKTPRANELDSSFHFLENNIARCYLRTPNTKFRPGCSDALHIDLWIKDKNILLSTGSYSYNCEASLQNYFPSVEAHNTVQFDQLEQMPKLSRFLYTDWIKSKILHKSNSAICAQYQNPLKHKHIRELTLTETELVINDSISGFKEQAKLRWHLAPQNWQLIDSKLLSDTIKIEIVATTKITQIALVDGYQSRYYLQKETIPVLEVTLATAGKITTTISWLN